MESSSETEVSTATDSNLGWSNSADMLNLSHENRRGRPKAATISNLMIEGAKSQSAIKCKFCARVFPREKSLQAHLRIHTGERPYTCNYPGCLRAFTQSGQLKTHLRLHTGEKPFVCPTEGCKYRFTHANRHCPNHPDATLVRCHSTILRPKLLNPNYAVKINDWFDSIDEASQTEDAAVVKKRRIDLSLVKNETEDNHVTCQVRKLSNELKPSTATVVLSNCNPTLECSLNYIIPEKHEFSFEQKIELPKKRWLRAAAQDQALIELNQSRPTVLMRAGKENENIAKSSQFGSNGICDWNNQFEYSTSRSTKYVKSKQNSPVKSFTNSNSKSHNLSSSFDYHSKCVNFSSKNTVVRNSSVLLDPSEVQNHSCPKKSNLYSDVPYKLNEHEDISSVLNDSLNLGNANDSLNMSSISASDLVPSLNKSNLDMSFSELTNEFQPFLLDDIYTVGSETVTNVRGSQHAQYPVINNSIYNSPDFESFIEMPSSPVKQNEMGSESSSLVDSPQKFNSAYKKNLHTRFMNQLLSRETTSINLQVFSNACVSSVDDDTVNIDNVLPKNMTDQIAKCTSDKSDIVDDELAYPLMTEDSKPLDLSGDNDYFQL